MQLTNQLQSLNNKKKEANELANFVLSSKINHFMQQIRNIQGSCHFKKQFTWCQANQVAIEVHEG